MKPITDCFETLKAVFEKSIITYYYYKIDPDEPEYIHLKNINDPGLIWEGHRFNLNGNALNGYYFKDLINQTKEEIISNLRLPIDTQAQKTYLENVFELSSKIEESIISKKGKWIHLNSIYDGFFYDELPEIDKKSLSDSLKDLKIIFRDLIAFINTKLPVEKQIIQETQASLRTPLEQKLIMKSPSFELSPFLIRNIDYFKEFIGQLIDNEFIGSTEKNKMLQIFSGNPIREPVVWIAEKGALKYLISQLKKNGIFKKHKAHWKTTSKCFKYENESIHSDELSTENFPTKPATLTKLNSIINPLINRHNELKYKEGKPF